MKAIVINSDRSAPALEWRDVPDPVHAADEVLVDVHYSALNRADLMQAAGNYPVPPGASEILGLEMAGVIAEVGAAVRGWHVGDRVAALLTGGGYAERVNVPQRMLMAMPDDWDFAHAAAIPEVFLTAYVNLFMEAGLRAGETVLIHGGASGVGTAGIQMAREAGCRVIVTAGTEEKVARCRELGADLAIPYRTADFVQEVQAFTRNEGVDVIMDMVGADYLARNLSLLRIRGRLVIISLLSGARTEINLGTLMRTRLRLMGSVLRPRSVDEKVEIMRRFQDQFQARLLDGRIQPIIDSVYPVAQAGAAHARMRANRNIGKIMLRVRD